MRLFLVIAALNVIPFVLSYEKPEYYTKYIANFGDTAVAPCIFKMLVEKKLTEPVTFTATPMLWILVVVAFAYSRHRARMILAEKSRYERKFFIKEWFEKHRVEEKERGIHPIDMTVRDYDFRYDDVKVTKEDFRALCREIDIPPHVHYDGWSPVIYTTHSVHITAAALSLLVCIVASFAVMNRVVLLEIEVGAAKPTICKLVDVVQAATTDSEVSPSHNGGPRLCAIGRRFTLATLDGKRKEYANSVGRAYLQGASNTVSRISNILFVLVAFWCMFHMWFVAFVKSTIRRKSLIVAMPHPVCCLAPERHTQLVAFALPLVIFASILIEYSTIRIRTHCS
ncbi:hypothetical protein Aduo_016609 [Ancylostoma duodenale]